MRITDIYKQVGNHKIILNDLTIRNIMCCTCVFITELIYSQGAMSAVKILRVLRVLRPLRAINRAKGLKVCI